MADIVPWVLILLMLVFHHLVDVIKEKIKRFIFNDEMILMQPFVLNDNILPNDQYFFQNGNGIEAREFILVEYE
jgi:hypothetical protein